MRVGLITCRVLPEPDPDHAPLARVLVSRGHLPIPVAWDDPGDATLDCDLFVLRSTWNYHEAHEAFLAWCRSAAGRAPLLNPLPVIEWNHHKRYLDDLAGAGVPVVPTVFVSRGSPCDVAAIADQRGWDHLVVKPGISCGSFMTRAFHSDAFADGQKFADRLVSRRDIMLQPFLPGFEKPGERSLVWIDGSITHAVRKKPRLAGQDECVVAEASPGAEELAVARAAIATVPEPLTYARVDLVHDDRSNWQVSELELIEPSLFFDHAPHALDRFVTALERRVDMAP